MKGKEYDYNRRLLFEGEYLNGSKWKGRIKEYYKDELILKYGMGKEKNLIIEGIYHLKGNILMD